MSLEQVDRLAKNVFWWDGKRHIPERLREVGFDPDNPVIIRLVTLVATLIGFPRHLSQHVGGFVISDAPLYQPPKTLPPAQGFHAACSGSIHSRVVG